VPCVTLKWGGNLAWTVKNGSGSRGKRLLGLREPNKTSWREFGMMTIVSNDARGGRVSGPVWAGGPGCDGGEGWSAGRIGRRSTVFFSITLYTEPTCEIT
jgi:hypothetical protein